MEWPSATAVAAWVGAIVAPISAIIAGLGLWLSWRTRQDAVAKAERESKAKRPWAKLYRKDAQPDPGITGVRVTVHNPTEGEFFITDLRVMRPRGAVITATYSSSGGWTEFSPAKETATVKWRVREPDPRDPEMLGATEDISVCRPEPSWFSWARRSSDAAQISFEIALSGETRPPMSEPVRIVAAATIKP